LASHVLLPAPPEHRNLHYSPPRRSSDLRAGVRPAGRSRIRFPQPRRAPIGPGQAAADRILLARPRRPGRGACSGLVQQAVEDAADRKSTRLNSSHVSTSYAVSCLKRKKRIAETRDAPTSTKIAPARGSRRASTTTFSRSPSADDSTTAALNRGVTSTTYLTRPVDS